VHAPVLSDVLYSSGGYGGRFTRQDFAGDKETGETVETAKRGPQAAGLWRLRHVRNKLIRYVLRYGPMARTKLMKLLFLIDRELYRRHGATVFRWKMYTCKASLYFFSIKLYIIYFTILYGCRI